MNNLNYHEQFMQRAIKLAKNGLDIIEYTPILGYVIVIQNMILIEDWKLIYEKLNNQIIKNSFLLSEATIYLTLEPNIKDYQISFINFILKYNIPKVVIGTRHPYSNGLGIKLLKLSGVEVIENILQYECSEINKKFFTFYQKKRPFITLKWTQSLNGIICNNIRKNNTLNQKYYQQLTEKWRTEETGFLIDNNSINNVILEDTFWYGKTAIIIILDQYLMIPHNHFIYNMNYKFIIFTEKQEQEQFLKQNKVFFKLKFDHTLFSKILDTLYQENIQSVIIETSQVIIQHLIKNHFWDEAKIFIYNIYLNAGIQAPKIIGNIIFKKSFLNDQILFIRSKL